MEYTRLKSTDREQIMILRSQGRAFTEIAQALGRSVSAITREVHRHTPVGGTYSALAAQTRANEAAKRHHTQRKLDNPRLLCIVQEKLKLRWSPEQIAAILRSTYPDDSIMHVSHETIYSYLYVQGRGELKKELIRYLRQHRPTRRRRKGQREYRGKIPYMVSIHDRPLEVEDRTVPGHWEGDLIMGARNQSALGTMVERMTRFVVLVPLRAHDAASVRRSFARNIRHLPQHVLKTLTYDQGKEMAEHAQFTMDTKVQVYFADPHSPWMRGTNENTNGLLRDFFPKGTDFSKVTTRQIRRVQHMLNERPRETLGWRTPKAAFEEVIKTHGSNTCNC
jgi:IS30 family transposase